MSDKSFGDCPSRNIVKNPLLSTAVTGLSIEDLTHNAVLVPVAATQGLITRSEHQIRTEVRQSDHEITNFPSGDSNTNVFSPLTTLPAYSPPLENPQPPHSDRQPEITTTTASKASVKSEDDFDVNEYFARLQGTRYVSAPINSNPDQNANLAAAEDNLEEINLNDDKNIDVQQSLTADIAQNFSQLPTVLPQVASAVFSSFSNMLSYKSREQTPDDRGYQSQEVPMQSSVSPPGYAGQNLAMDTPLMAEDVVKDVAPPPKEIPNSGASNFRITTKKKYAQIPGLSSGTNFETSQKIELNPLTKNVKNYFVPSNDANIFTEAIGTVAQENNNIPEQTPQETYNIFTPMADANNTASDFQPSVFNIPKETEPKPFEERLPPPPTTYDLHGSNAPNAAIPPPPMFSTQRPGSQTGKSVLPPSVARRIGSNQPVIKQQPMQTINTENIFVPTFDPMNYPTAAQPIGTSFSDIHSQSAYSTLVTEQPTSQSHEAKMPSIPPPAQFTPGFTPPPPSQTSVIAPPIKAPPRLPPQNVASPPSSMMTTNIAAPPMFAQTLPSNPPTMFVPSTGPVDAISSSGNESSLPPLSIFSPTSPAAQSISPPRPIQPSGSTANVAPVSYFTPPAPTIDAPSFYNPIVQEQPKPGQVLGSEPPKPMIEPPKATGSVSFRMNKKRPQYYSGPIEGVGSISNSIKPVIPAATVDSGTFQGALFTPEQPQGDQNLSSSVPFDLSNPAETVPVIPQYNIANPVNVQPPAAFDISQPAPGYPHFDITHRIQNPEPQYNTAFDLSRPTTDSYNQRDEPKESKGFGIIGSLKSKLSSLDINKIQQSMTTFFDPAYKDATKEETAAPSAQQNAPYSNMPYDAQAAQTNLEIFVPNAPQNNQSYNYSYQQNQNADYLNNEYYKYPNFQNQGQPSAGHCSNSQDYPSHSEPYNNNKHQGYPNQNTNTTMFQDTASYLPTQEATVTTAIDNVITEGPRTFKENQDFNAERNMDENVARAGPEVAKLVQSKTFIEESFAPNFFDVSNLGGQNPLEVPKAEIQPIHNAPQVPRARIFLSDSFDDRQERKRGPIIFSPDTKNLFINKEKLAKVYARHKLKTTENKDISSSGAEINDLFDKIEMNNEILEDIQANLLPAMNIDNKEDKEKQNDDIKTHNLEANPVIYEGAGPSRPKDSLLDSLNKTDVPILGVSSVPLFGLSTMLAEKSKEYIPPDVVTSLSDRNSSMSFFDHTQKLEDYGAMHADELSRPSCFSFFENLGTPTQEENANYKNTGEPSGYRSGSLFKNVHECRQDIKENTPENQDKMERDQNENTTKNIGTESQDENASELRICETCREVNKPDDREDDQDVTNQLIENITSPLQLSNPVETTLTEASVREPTNKEQVKIDAGQFEEISHITEETIETIQVQSATELLEEIDKLKAMGYGWQQNILKENCGADAAADSRGYFDDKDPAGEDETKHHEELLVRQMSVPSAPPAEDEEEDAKSDEAGKLDVNSIERDASKDFPLFEEYVIEPSSKDDDDDPKSENELDSFTNRVEKYKKKDPADDHQPLFYDIAPQPISMVSYFDTGNYAVEAHYRNTNTRLVPTIPPGFEGEYKRRLALIQQRKERLRNKFKTVPETSTQTRTTSVATYCSARIAPNYTNQSIVPVGFNIEANITSLVDEQSEPLPDFSTPPILKKAFEKKPVDEIEKIHDLRKDKKIKLPPIPNVFDPKPAEEQDSRLPEFALAPGFKPDVPEETPLPELLVAFSSKADDKIETILPPCAAFTISKPEEIASAMMPSFSAFIATNPEENPATMPTYEPFPISEPDEISEPILPPFSAFASSIPDNNLDTMLPPFAAFAASRAEENPAMIAPPFSAFKSSKTEDNSAQSVPPFLQFTTLKTDNKPETMPPSFAAAGTSRGEEETESSLPPLPKFTTPKSDENPVTVLPSFAASNTVKTEEENAALSLPPFELFTSKPAENPAEVVPPFGAFSTPKPEEEGASSLPPLGAPNTIQPEERAEPNLPDPINFFSDTTSNDPPENFSRLASYFSSPPKTEHAKSFFELSQSQNHYRHASTSEQAKIIDLMNDLTSINNLPIPKDQTVKHVNYFTVEYESVLPDFSKLDTANEKLDYPDFNNVDANEAVEFSDDIDVVDIDSILKNCRHCSKIFDTTFKVRRAVNEINGEQGSMNTSIMEPHKETGRGSVTVNFDGMTIQEEPNEGAASMAENRSATEYTPVKHHWFYRVDVEDKSIWRGFSVTDSRALEAANLSPDLNEHTLVATDGGRYDVNVLGRLRIPVYWEDKPTNVRRCSWFYKGTTDARYVPYTEPVAEKLEEEYRHGMTTAEWHRRLVLPNGEVVVMHGPSVMVHFLHSDAFSTPPQSSSRPRVVRRGHDESEIEDIEPSSIDHLLLLCHGVGSACDMRFRSVEEVVEDFRATSLQLVQSHYRNSYDQGVVSRVEVLPVSWHSTLHSGETGVDRRLAQITLDSIPRLRSFTNETVLDVLFYTSPVYCQTILDTVCKELNRIYELFLKRNPSFTGGVSLGGHSLGSVILYDLLCHQADVSTADSKSPDKNYVKGPAGTGQPFVRYPSLVFAPDAMYALGSPIAIFECIRGVDSLGANFSLPTCKNFFNIFHPYDPIAYRIEPLINPQLRDLKPHLIPHHKGRKRMHLELKDTMARVGADLKQKLLESLKSTWNKWKAAPPTDGQLEKVVEEELEKEQLTEDKEDLAREIELSTPDNLGRLNGGRRVDYVLQEAPLEMINEYLFAMSSHVGYWESEDTMLLMLREIYSALGVQPDSTVPQQNMTVQRTRITKPDEAAAVTDFPSTSRGPI